MKNYHKISIIKVVNNRKKVIGQDSVVTETPLSITINRKELLTLICLPSDLQDLTYGFLFSNGIISRRDNIKKIAINLKQQRINVTLSIPFKQKNRKKTYACSGSKEFAQIGKAAPVTSDFRICGSRINNFMSSFLNKSKIYSKTGGVHSAGLTSNKKIIIFRDDIGRHNAIDKVIGQMLLKNIPSHNKVLLTSGRISSEIVAKTQKAGIPIIVSKSAPTDRAIDLAKKGNITIVKTARSSLNIYCNVRRIFI